MRQIETKGMMEQFQAHLNNTNNQRIIFSGCFGSGKTTFLNNFFNDPEQQERGGSRSTSPRKEKTASRGRRR